MDREYPTPRAPRARRRRLVPGLVALAAAGAVSTAALALTPRLSGQDMLGKLGTRQNYRARRVSSFDPTGGNRDSIAIPPGQTAVLAEIKGPAAIDHVWTTIAAEPFYGRKIVLRVYWDGEESPSVEAPVGDFFAVGHGLNRNLTSIPVNDSSEGRARNCYWYMPFRWSCRVTATNEGSAPVDAFYYYIDYRELPDILPDAPYFHAQYRQELPCEPGRNYLILDAVGSGHYVGCNLSVLQRAMGWWGEGDDMFYVDGETTPSLHGTGSEDYFSDAWGMREGLHPFYGCPLQEEDFQAGSKATVYRFHLPDPVPFRKSLKVTIEHGHANDRGDFYSSVAYWYQAEPHVPFPPMPAVDKRLPFALDVGDGFILPRWTESGNGEAGAAAKGTAFEDKDAGMKMTAPRLSKFLTSFYGPGGDRFPALTTEGAAAGTRALLTFPAATSEKYDIDLFVLKGPGRGNVRVLPVSSAEGTGAAELGAFPGFATDVELGVVTLKGVPLTAGPNTIAFEVTGRDTRSAASEIGLVGLRLNPGDRRFAVDWNVIGPFEAPDMTALTTVYPPERETALGATYKGKGAADVAWKPVKADEAGYVNLADLVKPNEYGIAYGLAFVYSPDDRQATVLLGSDDGVRLWVNETLVWTNPAYRAAQPDLDRVTAPLIKGWNKVLVKVLQGAGGWGFFLRIADPKAELRWALQPEAEPAK